MAAPEKRIRLYCFIIAQDYGISPQLSEFEGDGVNGKEDKTTTKEEITDGLEECATDKLSAC